MLFPAHIGYTLEGSDYAPPRMFTARQLFPRTRLENVEGAAAEALSALSLPPLSGKRVALTAGSRGVANQALILKTVAQRLKQAGAVPFIVPGLGSHGGATAEGQREFIAGYGITEEAMGVPILSDMAVVDIGKTRSGVTVYCDKNAAVADYILPVHRVKPHTDFKSPIESGICKMLAIGLGKHKGATSMHRLGFAEFPTLVPEAAEVFFATGKVLGGVAMVENAYDETMLVEAIPTEEIIEREKALLALAKSSMAKLYMDSIDVLVVEEIGKEISGAGMDSNITARPVSGEPGFQACPIRRIAVLGLSQLSHGNGNGLGMADVVTNSLVQDLDLAAAYINGVTACALEAIRIPVVANTDLDAVRICINTTVGVSPESAKIVQIADTLHLSTLRMSEAYLPLIKNDKRFEILSSPEPAPFAPSGRLMRLRESESTR